MSYVLKCASYSRLSREDKEHDESSSIITQKQIINSFAKFNNFNIIEEYVDDGFSGGNFDRPGFQKMIRDIEAGKINCVITKDLSRLGREIYKTGEYIEEYFLERGVRYIAINDGFDSNIGDAMLGIRLGVNDLYLRDISRKVSSAMRIKQEKGDYIGSFACFGYKKDPLNKNHLIPDDESKEIVKKIFELYDKGYTLCEIADYLSSRKIPIPLVYRNDPKSNKTIIDNDGNGYWKHQTIVYILTNPIYIGNMRQHMQKKLSYRSKKIVKVPISEQIIVENTHEAVIDKELFDRVQNKLKRTKIKHNRNNSTEYLFKGLLICKDCGKTISISVQKNKCSTYLFTRCNSYSQRKQLRSCTPHHINYSMLERDLLKFIRKIGKEFLNKYDVKKISEKCKVLINDTEKEYNYKLNELEINIKRNVDSIAKLYEDRIDGIVSVDMYKSLSEKYENKINELKEEKVEILNKLETLDKKIDTKKYEECKEKIEEFLSLKNPTNETIREIIDRIEINEDKRVEVYFKLKPLEIN